MKRLILPLAFSVFATLASAENITVFVPLDGGGVTQIKGNITVQEAALLMGDSAPPNGATGVVLERGKPARWTNLSPQGVNEAFDGEGPPPIKNRGAGAGGQTANEDLVFEDPNARNDDDTTDLASEGTAGADKIRPLAGDWIGIVLDQTFEGCPAGIAEAVSAQTSALDLSVVQGDISPSFDPAVSMPQFSWETNGPNAWIGDMDMTQGGAGMRVQWAMRVVNPSLINGRQQINVVGPMMGGCTIFLRFQYERVG